MTEYLCLSDLLDSDLSSYEYFCSLPENIKQKIEMEDARSFSEMQDVLVKIIEDDKSLPKKTVRAVV